MWRCPKRRCWQCWMFLMGRWVISLAKRAPLSLSSSNHACYTWMILSGKLLGWLLTQTTSHLYKIFKFLSESEQGRLFNQPRKYCVFSCIINLSLSFCFHFSISMDYHIGFDFLGGTWGFGWNQIVVIGIGLGYVNWVFVLIISLFCFGCWNLKASSKTWYLRVDYIPRQKKIFWQSLF